MTKRWRAGRPSAAKKKPSANVCSPTPRRCARTFAAGNTATGGSSGSETASRLALKITLEYESAAGSEVEREALRALGGMYADLLLP